MFRKTSIKLKLCGILLIVSLVPLLILIGIITSRYDSALREQIQDKQSTLAFSTVARTDQWLKQKISAIEETVEHQKDVFLSGKVEPILSVLRILKTTDKEIRSFGYMDPAGMAYGSDGVNNDFNQIKISENRTLAEQMSSYKETSVSDIQNDVQTNGGIVSIAVPILDDQGVSQGVIFSVISVDIILKDINMLRIGETGYAYLLSGTGNMIAHPREEWVGKSYKDVFDEETAAIFDHQVMPYDIGNVSHEGQDGGAEELKAFSTVRQTGWKVVVSGKTDELMSKAGQIKILAYTFAGAVILVIVILALLISQVVLGPLLSVSNLMKRVANGDLTERLTVKTGDEVGRLQEHINMMLDAFEGIIRMIGRSVHHTADSSATLKEISIEAARTADGIAVFASEVAFGSEAQYEASRQSATAMDSIADGSHQIAQSISLISEHTATAYDSIVEGKRDISEAIGQMKKIHDSVSASANKVHELEAGSKEIDLIVQLISGVASQTNILALNAGIEAARAGQQGKGFAVVAEEFKKLSGQTAMAIKRIMEILSRIQTAAVETAHSMNGGLREVKLGVDAIEGAGTAIDHMVSMIQNVNARMVETAAVTEEISASTEEISAAMMEIWRVAGHSMNQLRQISDTSTEQKESMNGIAIASEQLAVSSAELKQMIQQFKISNGTEA